jgi:hypothetical protein
MNEASVRKFCESRHRRLIVIAGTFVVGLLLVVPIVDVYYAGRDEKSALADELDSARRMTSDQGFESRVAEKLAQLAAFEGRAVDEDSLPALRGSLMEIAKETGCSIRRLNVGATSTRPWLADDDPMAPKLDARATSGDSGTGFMLEWRPVNISLSGTSANLRDLLQRITDAGMFMHTKSMEMFPSNANRQSLTLDLELWYFTLARNG